MASHDDQEHHDLAPEHTAGFKVGEKKTMDEYNKLDANDESLRKWKQSLGVAANTSTAPGKCSILSLGLEVEGRPDIIIDLSDAAALATLKNKPFIIKEGAQFRMKVTFKVENQILSGLKYVQKVSRMGVTHKNQEMIGSYGPNPPEQPFYEKKFGVDTAPSGMLGRGQYSAACRFIDDDKVTHLLFDWSFKVEKDWS